MKRIKITKDDVDEIREELQWHMKSLSLMQEQVQKEYINQLAQKEKEK